jgi:hypothetical protein
MSAVTSGAGVGWEITWAVVTLAAPKKARKKPAVSVRRGMFIVTLRVECSQSCAKRFDAKIRGESYS